MLSIGLVKNLDEFLFLWQQILIFSLGLTFFLTKGYGI